MHPPAKPLQCLIHHSEGQCPVPNIRLPPPNLGTSINRLICFFLSPPWHFSAPKGFQGGALFLGMLEQSNSTKCKEPKSSCIPDLPCEVRACKRRSCSSSPTPGGESPPGAAGAQWLASGCSSSY